MYIAHASALAELGNPLYFLLYYINLYEFHEFFMKIRLNHEMKMNFRLLNEMNSEFRGAVHDVYLGALRKIEFENIGYRCSKTALSVLMFDWSHKLKEDGVKVWQAWQRSRVDRSSTRSWIRSFSIDPDRS